MRDVDSTMVGPAKVTRRRHRQIHGINKTSIVNDLVIAGMGGQVHKSIFLQLCLKNSVIVVDTDLDVCGGIETRNRDDAQSVVR